MPIWGNRDTEPPAEEYESQTGADGTEQPASRDQAGEPAPASWRAQGETPDGDGAPVPVLTGDIVVLEGQTAVKDPATADAQDGLRQGTEQPAAGAESPIVMGGSEPDVAGADQPGVAGAESPIVMGAGEPDVAGAEQPAAAGAESPIVMGAGEPVVAGAEQPAAARGESPIVTEADQPGMAGVAEPGVAGVAEPGVAGQPAASPAAADAISPQRWSEILVGFVDDPRGSVQTAADAVDQAIDGFVNSVRARQHDLASSWQGAGADTEQLRTALREYRRLGERVQELDLGQRTSG